MAHIEAADYHDLVQVGAPRVSPTGDAVAFVRTVPDGDEYEATVYLAATDGTGATRFSVVEGRDAEPRFSPSGDRLAFVSTRGDVEGAQLWVAPTDGGEARRATDVPGGVADLVWSPDGDRIAFTQRVTAAERQADIDCDRANADEDPYERPSPDPRVVDRTVYRSREGRVFDGTRRHVFVLDLDAASVTRVTDGDADHRAPAWGDADTLYYAVRRAEDPDDTVQYDVDAHDLPTGTTERRFRTTGYPQHLAATTDGRVAHHFAPADRTTIRQDAVHVYDPETDETRDATAGIDRTVQAFAWGPDEEAVYVSTPDEGAVTLWRTPWDGDGSTVVVRDGHLSAFHVTDAGVGFVQSEWDHPGDVFFASPDGADQTRLTRVNESLLADREVAEPESFTFESEGAEIQGWVLTPPGADDADDETHPLAVQIHGGPHIMWSDAGSTWHEFQTLAARGYAVFWCNPRGSAGYGEAFVAANDRDWGAVTMADVTAGADRVAERPSVDADAQFVTGGSFGGYATGWLVGHTDRFDAAVAQRGVYHLAGFYGTTDEAFRLVEDDWDATPTEDPTLLWEHSPVAHADAVTTPTLVLHAEEDYRVPVSEAETFYRLLRKHGVETRFVRYPEEGHDLSRGGAPPRVVDRIERIARWFDGHSDHHDAPPAVERPPGEGLSRSPRE
jgi:dipeptidyl aminopeptidase/acylaminoacyl peptidase